MRMPTDGGLMCAAIVASVPMPLSSIFLIKSASESKLGAVVMPDLIMIAEGVNRCPC